MAGFPAVCVESDVNSLKDIATRFCVKNPHVFCQYNLREAGCELQEGLALPQGICEKILSVCKDELKGDKFKYFIKLFKDVKRTRLQLVDLSDSHVTDEILEFLTDHQITRLNISGCKLLTYAALNSVAKLKNLQSLIIGSSSQVFEMYRFKRADMLALLSQHDFFMKRTSIFPPPKPCEPPSFLRLPLLKNLVIHDVPKLERNLCFMSIMDLSRCLTHLDLSNCKVHLNQMNDFLASSDLVSLTLRDVLDVNHLFHAICKIKSLSYESAMQSGEGRLCTLNLTLTLPGFTVYVTVKDRNWRMSTFTGDITM
ncbi:hypothetical protein AVEN_174176-1 [Araneus ventricosus]|uniref:Uncharacterized protein n=1 Tax=Araneus ventricosus TaxID=182803 RepID=A0A4Y2T6H8_ARAVE|nr:hypothetical protein AVEN_174176-1 [Araneus ventricosus]